MKAILPKAVLALSQLAANESQNRFGATQCVLLTAKDGNFRAEATNGRYLGILNGYAEGECDMLIDAKKFAEIKKVMDKEADRIVFETKGQTFTAGGIKPFFHTNGDITGLEPISKIGGEFHQTGDDGYRWPNTNQVIPSGKVACTFRIDPRMLIEVLRCAMAVDQSDAPSVTFTIFRQDKPIAISARNEEGSQYGDFIVVPLVPSK